ncbi:MAG: type II toxin-antitoxin system VapC family toxin [Acidimicrobiia bacterium]|nr:type II toxin-antitoxin system VapC family toxin [Acidimicrobiia bacterium]
MTRFVLDVGAVLHVVTEGIEVAGDHELLAPTLLRSQVLDEVFAAVRRGELAADIARERLELVAKLKMRYLGDAVLRRQAWKVAERLGWASTYRAEYVALTQLQGDALVTLDGKLAREVDGVVRVAGPDELRR